MLLLCKLEMFLQTKMGVQKGIISTQILPGKGAAQILS